MDEIGHSSTLRSRTPSLSRPAQHKKMMKDEMAKAMVAKNDFLVVETAAVYTLVTKKKHKTEA